MAQNVGTLISSSIRPNDSLDPIASAFAKEIKGGLHTATASSDRDSIITQRREWGMMCYVINDDALYQLKYNYASVNINDNTNWVVFSGGSGGGSGEWVDSVLSRQSAPPGLPVDGDRYLITSVASGAWISLETKIAQYDGTIMNWVYTTPTDGMSVRVDDEDNSVYMYEGTYPSGIWNKELLNQVRFISATSSDGLQYNALSTPLFTPYMTEMLFLTTFGTANSGSASLSVNGLGDVILKKLSGTGLDDLDPLDISTGIVYTVSYDGTYFQVNIPVGATSVGVIGPAEDGDYTDGLFTDFTQTTPIGVPIDRFNEILKSLVPPPAPILSDWSGSKAGTNVSGKLSFDSTHTIPLSSPTYSGGDLAPVNPISVDGTWTISGKRLGISPNNGGNLTGTLNYQVPVHSGLPTPAYVAASFTDANLGYLRMYVNGVLIVSATVDLSILTSSSSGVNSGFTITAATASKFPGGDPFNTFLNRTGTWQLRSDDVNLTNGYNYVHVVHDNSAAMVGPFTRTLDRFEFIVDDDVTATSISGATISSYTLTGSKLLSGIKYYTGGSLRYDVTVDNLYRNTYYHLSDAISFSDQSSGTTIPVLTTSATLTLAPCGGTESKQFKISNVDQNGSSLTFSIISSGKRRSNESISMNVTAKRTIQGNTSGGLASVANVLLDNVSSSSTLLVDNFDDETYRLMNTYGGFQYDLYSLIPTNPWDSSQSLIGGTSGWTDGLQVTNGRLIYPVTNFSSFGNLTTNLNYGDALTSYNTATGDRVYIRYFRQVSPTTGNFRMTINGSGGTFVPLTTSLTGNNIHVEIKAPGSGAAETGWLDAYDDFATGQWNDGDGARDSVSGVGRAFATLWGLTIGTKNTANTDGYMVIRITVGQTFTGYMDSITWQFT